MGFNFVASPDLFSITIHDFRLAVCCATKQK